MRRLNKHISVVLLVSIFGSLLFFDIPKARAADPITWAVCGAYEATIGKLFGKGEDMVNEGADKLVDKAMGTVSGDVPTSDKTTHTGQKAQVASDKKIDCENFMKDVVLAALKKRLLNIMTNQVVDWINRGAKGPLFTTSFGKIFTDAGDAAVGDVLQQVGEGKLCSPFAFNITLQLQQPAPLSEQVQCSLSKVINNFQDYGNHFANGGWIAYEELLKPQNNQWGIEIITQNEIANRTAKKTSASILQQQINVGFNSEACNLWQLTDDRNGAPVKGEDTSLPGSDYPDPKTQPPIPLKYAQEQSYYWRCTEMRVTTPGRTLAATLEKATGADFDYIITSKDLANSLAIIADAAFNKLIKSGVEGLQKFSQSGGEDSMSPAEKDRINNASAAYEEIQRQATGDKVRFSYLDQLNPIANTALAASSTLAIASSTNQDIISTGQELLACPGINSADTAFAQNAMGAAKTITSQTIVSKSAEVKTAHTAIRGLISSVNAGNCGSSCQSQIDTQRTAASNLNVDANNILLGVQNTLNELQTMKKNDCHT